MLLLLLLLVSPAGSRQRPVHRDRHVGPRRVPGHVGVHVRAVRRHRVRRGQRGPDAAGRGQRRAGHAAPAPGRGRPAGHARAVRSQQDSRGGRVRAAYRRQRAPARRAHGTGPTVAVGRRRRVICARRTAGRRRVTGGHGMAGGPGPGVGPSPPMTVRGQDGAGGVGDQRGVPTRRFGGSLSAVPFRRAGLSAYARRSAAVAF